jgi:hypothetical protein
VAIQYQIEGTVLVLKLAPEGFAELRRALRAAAADPRACPGMPLLIDGSGSSRMRTTRSTG